MFKKLNYLKFLLAVLILTLASCKYDDIKTDMQIAKAYCSLQELCIHPIFLWEYEDEEECVNALFMEAHIDKTFYPECHKANRSLYMCLSALSCMELDKYLEQTTDNHPCTSHDQKAKQACPDADDFDWDNLDLENLDLESDEFIYLMYEMMRN